MAFSFAPILAGVLYSLRPETPLLSSIALGSVLIPVLVYSQRRLSAPRAADLVDDTTEIEVLSPVDEAPPLVAPDGPERLPAERDLTPARPVAVPDR
jgi:hypothetical protein